MSPAETLRAAIHVLRDSSSIRERRTAAAQAQTAMQALLAAQPPADAPEAEKRGYHAGLLASIALAHKARDTHEMPLRAAESIVGDGYAVLAGARHYGQSITGTFELLVQKALGETLGRKP